MTTKHKDVEYHAQARGSDHTEICETWDQAKEFLGEWDGVIDVVVWSRAGARHYGGDAAVEAYNEDPDASVFERWVSGDGEFECEGRVP